MDGQIEVVVSVGAPRRLVVAALPDVGVFGGRVSLTGPVALRGDLVGVGVQSSIPTVPVTGPESTAPASTVSPPPTGGPPTTPLATTPPATSPPATVPDGGDELTEQLERCEEDARHAQVRFTPALTMVVGEISDVDVSATIGEDQVPPPTGTGPPVTVVPAVLHCEVEATLRGQGFQIDPAEPQRGSFLDHPEIRWTWQVTPESPGVRTLQFRIVPVARSGELELPGTPVPFEATITVEAEPRSFWQEADDVVRGIAGHPVVTGFGALAGIAAALAAGWRWVLKRPWPWAPASGGKSSGRRPWPWASASARKGSGGRRRPPRRRRRPPRQRR